VLKVIQPLADATTETLKRLIEMYEFAAFGVVNATQLVAGAVSR
jgi:hypothetical protein